MIDDEVLIEILAGSDDYEWGFNHIVVIGKGGVCAEAFNDNVDDPGSIHGENGVVSQRLTIPVIETAEDAQALADAVLDSMMDAA